jgi:hypothetical protein
MAQGPPPPGPPEGWKRPPHEQGWGQPPQQPPPGPPTQPQWGQAPYPGSGPPPPPKPGEKPLWRRWWVIGLFILAALAVIGTVFGDPPQEQASKATVAPTTAAQASSAPTTVSESEPETTAKPATTEGQTDLREPVRDGKFEFVVRSLQCGGTTCRSQVAVKNIGNEAQYMFADNQYLFDAQGRRFSADSTASSESLFLQELNPGLDASGTIVWRVPANVKPDHLELHDSAFSGGVEVKV